MVTTNANAVGGIWFAITLVGGAGVSQLRKYKPDDAPVLCDSLRGLLQSHGRKRTFVVFECVRTALHG